MAAYEARVQEPPPPAARVRRTSPFELAGYVGLALALGGTSVALVSRAPSQGLLAVVEAVIAGGLVVAGAFAGMVGGDPFTRMRSVMWFGAIIVWAYAAGLTFGPGLADLNGRSYVFVVALLVAAPAIGLWWREHRSLQAVAAVAAVFVALMAAGYAEHVERFALGAGFPSGFQPPPQTVPDFTPDAILAMLFGFALILLAWRDVLSPKRTIMVLGSIIATYSANFVSFHVLGGGQSALGVALALIASAVILVVGELADVLAVRGLGIVGLLSQTVALLTRYVHGRTGGWLVAAVGFAVLGATVVLAGRTFPTPAIRLPPVPPTPAEPLSGEPQG
ncbi:MAG: hypothetical protein ABI828_06500 [Actinomycetota bacterium]